ncbi:hypothetical protein HCA15_03650 [Listeria booriae]|uniref:hypothetical protein n=1 Tax=Listeria booriae TaxID=1552123 RepID=UPI00164E6C63|nr:hypothetical protein [Listeria booriae]MBC6165731.1 hypothetical protein [Listeria booriae]
MARPVKNRPPEITTLHGVWTLTNFAEASPRTYGWWIDNISDYPEIQDFSNWATKSKKEQWAFDAVEANKWLLKHFVYKN